MKLKSGTKKLFGMEKNNFLKKKENQNFLFFSSKIKNFSKKKIFQDRNFYSKIYIQNKNRIKLLNFLLGICFCSSKKSR